MMRLPPRLALLAVALIAATLALYSCNAVRLPFGLIINSPDLFSRGGGEPIDETELGQRIEAPAGFAIGLYASGITNARVLRFTDNGDLIVSSPRQRKLFLLNRDGNGDGRADGQRVLLEDLNDPHGFALHDGWLYVAETDAILRVRFDAARGEVVGAAERIVTGIPGGGNHWRRVIGIGPDGWLYLSIGSSCNVCIEDDPRRGGIHRYRLDGSGGEVFAMGLRNSAGFDWQPGSAELYATDNGRDLLGDDSPPCELNRVVHGGFYGWPYANGAKVPDPDYGSDAEKVAKSIAPAHPFGAHTAPLGITFYAVSAFPEPYRSAAFVALHGSWNRTSKNGYKVVALHFAADGSIREEDFLSGFERDEHVIGRPAYFAVGPDGALYVSDDYSGSIYRVSYGAGGAALAMPAAEHRGDPLAQLDPATLRAASERGETLWHKYPCAQCHNGVQAAPLKHLSAKYDIDSLTAFLRSPQPPMPQFPLTEGERRDLAIHLLQQHP